MKHRIPEIFKLKITPGPGFCRVKGCRKPLALDRKGNVKKLGLCHGHYQHAWRLCNERQSAYATLRDSAEKRGIKFTISPEYFDGLCDAYGYFDHEAEEFKDYLSIDRVKAHLGYEKGNLRIVTVSVNAAKANAERHLPEHVQAMLQRRREELQQGTTDEEDPF